MNNLPLRKGKKFEYQDLSTFWRWRIINIYIMQGSANARSLRVSKSKKKSKLNIVAIILKGTLGHHNFSLQKASNIRRNALF